MEKFATLVDLDHRVKPDGDKNGADASPNLDDDNIRAECQFALNKRNIKNNCRQKSFQKNKYTYR